MRRFKVEAREDHSHQTAKFRVMADGDLLTCD